MCGKAVATRKHLVDGTIMNLGTCCTRYGTPVGGSAAPAPAGSPGSIEQGLARRAQRGRSRDIFDEERLELVDDYGKRIREARERKGISKEMLGGKVAARVPQLNQIESNHLRPSDGLAKALERELGIKLFEAVEAGAPKPAPKAAGGAGLTIGDLLKNAKKK